MKHNKSKNNLHKNNAYCKGYDFKLLCESYPKLKSAVIETKYGNQSIDFFNANSVKLLNAALLINAYDLKYWDIPKHFLCPAVPGRMDYIHYFADFLKVNTNIHDKKFLCLDIGTGANCIYPLIGYHEYGWNFIASDINKEAIHSAETIVNKNNLKSILIRFQKNKNFFFKNIIKKDEKIDFTICNPPFFSSLAEANKANFRKVSNLKKGKSEKIIKNFEGRMNEVCYNGGELNFVSQMIKESMHFKLQCNWFSCLISQERNLPKLNRLLAQLSAKKIEILKMSHGQKKSRILVWSF